ncbi:MAG: hypothetical protein HY426_04230 [Candidatus Levybacteria bacterium]|nr:hypothetical protein [Candidatus Levybacteria bacterium]
MERVRSDGGMAEHGERFGKVTPRDQIALYRAAATYVQTGRMPNPETIRKEFDKRIRTPALQAQLSADLEIWGIQLTQTHLQNGTFEAIFTRTTDQGTRSSLIRIDRAYKTALLDGREGTYPPHPRATLPSA